MIRGKKLVKLKEEEVKPLNIMKTESEDKETYDNQFEVLSTLPRVKSEIKRNITSDYTMSVLNPNEKEFIIENYGNAEYAEEIIDRFAYKGYSYRWDNDNLKWFTNKDGSFKKFPLEEDEKKVIKGMSSRIFKLFMLKPHMINVLNRNRSDNFIVKLLGKQQEEEQPVAYGTDDRNIIQKVWDKLRGTEEEVVEE